MKYVIGNWKANKNLHEIKKWIEDFKKEDLQSLKDSVTIIICPPHPFIQLINSSFKDFDHITSGAQDISFYGAGAYTGEIAAHNLEGLVDYTIIGHSERRQYFKENDATVDQKVSNALGAHIKPIVCVRNIHDQIPKDVTFVAYEPEGSIGTGNNVDADEVAKMKQQFQLEQNQMFIYGGSVNGDNCADYLQHDAIDGVLPGGASLDPHALYAIAKSSIK